ncbi:PREDICTED: B3 domain-containing protein REM14 [Camelina sativa]|uniref:B3 domain-containing protein REM14 n=1 Tax=Camelina sativa TaxID=90675 RepID=A0ABM1QED9_CAMSA|nr:PREDICTED: B3 domain-containing protein REM14 [Camelina sativa]
MSFVRANGLDRRCGEIILMNEKGRSWSVSLKRRSCGTTYIRGGGWRSFCQANGLRAGDFSSFKLIQRGGTLGLRISPGEIEEEDCLSEGNVVKSRSIWKASSSESQNRFVTVTLTPYNIRESKLTLPIPFTKVNGLQKAKKMSFLDKHGVKWSTKMCFEVERNRMGLAGGWKEFCNANGVKIGESIILELVWGADRSSVLKFCSKVKQETN